MTSESLVIRRWYDELEHAGGDRLAEVDAVAAQLVQSVVPLNTTAAFDQDWAHWETFCRECAQMPAATVSSGLLVAFARWLVTEHSHSPETIHRRLTGVRSRWMRLGLVVPKGVTSDARKYVRGYAKWLAQENLPAGRGKAPALTAVDLHVVAAALPDTLAGVRDRAILTVGFATAARRSELAALLVSDITRRPRGLKVRIRDSKTGHRHPAVRHGRHDATCPVRAWEAWLAESGISDGPAFRAVTRHGRVRDTALHPDSVRYIVERAGRNAGLSQRVTGHSLRSGFATSARAAGKDTVSVARQGGWLENSRALYGYFQTVDEWADNATDGIGL